MYIYKLTDINGLVYVGKTKNVDERLHTHKAKNWNTTSSRKLDFNGIKIEVMEECPEDISFERERYWINKFDSVNINKLNYNDLDYKRKRNAWIRSWGKHNNSDNNLFYIKAELVFV